jgi:hypothetical protein
LSIYGVRRKSRAYPIRDGESTVIMMAALRDHRAFQITQRTSSTTKCDDDSITVPCASWHTAVMLVEVTIYGHVASAAADVEGVGPAASAYQMIAAV